MLHEKVGAATCARMYLFKSMLSTVMAITSGKSRAGYSSKRGNSQISLNRRDTMATTTAGIIALVRSKLGDPVYNPASDRAIARALKVSHSMIDRYERGGAVMTMDVLARAFEVIKVAQHEEAEFVLLLSMDLTTDEAAKARLDPVHRWFMERAKHFEPEAFGEHLKKVASGILLALLVAFTASKPVSALDISSPAALKLTGELYIIRTGRARRLRRARRRIGEFLGTVFPALDPTAVLA
jgi:transcriptional regulator with XRE-family HTH domain